MLLYLYESQHNSVHYTSWEFIHIRRPNSVPRKELIALFPPDESSLEGRQLSSIHKCVLGLTSISLEEQLRLSSKYLDDGDGCGRTPLHWALAAEDDHAIRTLLEWGADPNNKNHRGVSALNQVCRPSKQDEDVMRLLLLHHADPNTQDMYLRTPISFAAKYQKNDCAVLKLLLEAGAEVDRRDHLARTPLMCAIQHGCSQNAQLLIDRGADIHAQDNKGWTSVIYGICYDQHECVDVLFRNGADCRGNFDLLHILADQSDIAMLGVFAKYGMSPVDTEFRDITGRTARESAVKYRSRKTVKAFEMLLEAIN